MFRVTSLTSATVNISVLRLLHVAKSLFSITFSTHRAYGGVPHLPLLHSQQQLELFFWAALSMAFGS